VTADVTVRRRFRFCADIHLHRRGCSDTPPKWSAGYGAWLCPHCYAARTLWVEGRVSPDRPLMDDELGEHWRRLRGWSVMGIATVRNRKQEDGWKPRKTDCPGCNKSYVQGRRDWDLCLTCALAREREVDELFARATETFPGAHETDED